MPHAADSASLLQPPKAIRVSTADTLAHGPAVVPDGSGGAYIAWLDRRSGTDLVYAQRLMADGLIAPGWPPEGRLASTTGRLRDHLAMISDLAGGAFVAWDERYLTKA